MYDCTDASRALLDYSALRMLGRCMSLGEAHFPDNLYKCFVINAPSWASFVWGTLKPFLGESTRKKITISSNVPGALTEALGGDAAVEAMMASVPKKLPVEAVEVE